MKTKLAKYAIFDSTKEGADFMVTSRDKDGKPLLKYEDASDRLNDFSDRHRMQIRKVN